MTDTLTGKVAIVTGSARNIGRAIAHALSDGINVNVVAPGHVDTTRGESAGQASSVPTQRAMARKAQPEEIAAMVCHLCLPAGRYVTGQTIHVNGGMLFAGA
jgi:3-oxoacyl-[acyl-carrier protein] reductase